MRSPVHRCQARAPSAKWGRLSLSGQGIPWLFSRWEPGDNLVRSHRGTRWRCCPSSPASCPLQTAWRCCLCPWGGGGARDTRPCGPGTGGRVSLGATGGPRRQNPWGGPGAQGIAAPQSAEGRAEQRAPGHAGVASRGLFQRFPGPTFRRRATRAARRAALQRIRRYRAGSVRSATGPPARAGAPGLPRFRAPGVHGRLLGARSAWCGTRLGASRHEKPRLRSPAGPPWRSLDELATRSSKCPLPAVACFFTTLMRGWDCV